MRVRPRLRGRGALLIVSCVAVLALSGVRSPTHAGVHVGHATSPAVLLPAGNDVLATAPSAIAAESIGVLANHRVDLGSVEGAVALAALALLTWLLTALPRRGRALGRRRYLPGLRSPPLALS